METTKKNHFKIWLSAFLDWNNLDEQLRPLWMGRKEKRSNKSGVKDIMMMNF